MTPDDIVRIARSKVGSHSWLYDSRKDNFAEKTNKCNQFVYDVLVEAGVKPPPEVPKWHGMANRAPTAGEWATSTTMIPGWIVVTEAQPGDVVAEAHNYSDATGHVGIVVGASSTVSAAALPPKPGTVVENDWGFRSGQTPTFRRCTLFVTGKKP
jgi:hypothetical protein